MPPAGSMNMGNRSQFGLMIACLGLLLSGCESRDATSSGGAGAVQLGPLCGSGLARLSRGSEPIHDVVMVLYHGRGQIKIETFDRNETPLAVQYGQFVQPVGSRYDSFTVPLQHGAVVTKARLTMRTAAGGETCVVEAK